MKTVTLREVPNAERFEFVFNSKASGGQADGNAEKELKERTKDNDRN